MNIFKCSHAIPRLYQLSNGIFVPMNIENGHNRLCTLFFIHSHIHIWAVFHWNSSTLKKVKYTILYIFEGGFINIYNKNTIHAESCRIVETVPVDQSWKSKVKAVTNWQQGNEDKNWSKGVMRYLSGDMCLWKMHFGIWRWFQGDDC